MLDRRYPDATLLLIGHGSTVNEDSSATVLQHVAELRRRAVFGAVKEAFFKIEPRIGSVLASIQTSQVFAVPLFVCEGYFTRQAIPHELGFPEGKSSVLPCSMDTAGKQLVYCPPVGTHPLMTEIILARANAVLAEPHNTTALVIAGHGTELNPDSRKAVEKQVELIASRGHFAEVWPAFLEEEPRIANILTLVKSPQVVVVPFFMSNGLHVSEDIPVLLGESEVTVRTRLAACVWPWRNPTEIRGRKVYYTRGVGSEPGIAEVILQRVDDAATALNLA